MNATPKLPRALRRAAGIARKPWAAALAAAVILAAGGSGFAYAATGSIPSSAGVFTACYKTSGGALRLIDPSAGQECAASEKQVTWDATGITWDGTWSAAATYTPRDAITYNGSTYIAVTASKDKNPAATTADWAILAKAGATGPKGATGPAGQTGPQGPAGTPPQPDLSRVAALNWWGGPYSGSAYGFNEPNAIAFDGTHLWVTNAGGNSVTEINAGNGSVVRVLSASAYGFNAPYAIAFDGTRLWVTNAEGNSVTEINASNGSVVQVLSASSYGFNEPVGIAFDGTRLGSPTRRGTLSLRSTPATAASSKS
jgi:hypothetical protein